MQITEWYHSMGGQVMLTFVQKYAILLRCKSLEIKGGLEGIGKVQLWSKWRFGLKKAPSYRLIKKIEMMRVAYIV